MSFTTFASSGSVFIKPNLIEQAQDQVFRKTPFLDLLNKAGRIFQTEGSGDYRFNILTEGNQSVGAHTEGAAVDQSTAGGQQSKQVVLAPFWEQALIKISGHQRSNLINNGLYQDAWALEAQKSSQDLLLAVETVLLGTTTNIGLGTAVDSADTYGGQTVALNSAWKSYEAAYSGSVLLSMDTAFAALTKAPYTMDVTQTVICMPPAVITKFTTEMAASFRGIYGSGGNDVGLRGQQDLAWNGIPVITIAGMTSTEMYFLDMSALELRVQQNLTVRPLAALNNDDCDMLLWAGELCVLRRNACGKITGL